MHSAFVARHPIFNRRLEVVGCELLFRGHGWAEDERPESRERATATVVLNSLTELDLARIVGHRKAWVDVSREFVLNGLAQAIPAELSGLEISGAEVFDEELIEALDELKQEGYQLALDGVDEESLPAPALALFDIVKLDVRALGHERLRSLVPRLREATEGRRCKVLAQGIATYEDRDLCLDAGCDLFQGRFFCRPAVAGTRSVSANRLALLQVVSALQRSDVELSEVEQLIARDVALSFRMLRYVNSAALGLRGEVRSIGQALALLGLDNARRWATLSVMASVDDKPTELTLTALTRARFCELAGTELGPGRGSELFTLGLFSVLDALMDTTMSEATELLPLADDIRDALVDRSGPMGELLQAVIAREQGEVSGTRIPHADEYYLRAVIWAGDAAESLFAGAPPLALAPAPASVPPRAPEPASAVRPERGALARCFAAFGRLFGLAG
ncbi:MAG TPA: HDOD domain-containing protein [Solirubrobacteraceae bacterium]|nr:HDOD domain-containing protein [Solirubrobacteraceae bacterium]